MGALDTEMVEDGDCVLYCKGLAVSVGVLWHVRGGIAAGVVGNAAVAPRKVADLRLPAQVVAGELVNEEHGMAGSRLLEIEPGPVRRLRVGHG